MRTCTCDVDSKPSFMSLSLRVVPIRRVMVENGNRIVDYAVLNHHKTWQFVYELVKGLLACGCNLTA